MAARVAGKDRLRISFEHILPNLLGLLVVQGTIQFSLGVIAEAGLSYVGLSAQPPTLSWGRMLNEAQTLTALAPYLALFPGFAVLLFVLGLNLLGEGLRRRAGYPSRRRNQGERAGDGFTHIENLPMSGRADGRCFCSVTMADGGLVLA